MALPPLHGVFLTPGVSRNNRHYSKELIGKAVSRMQARIADPDGLPIVMRTSHDAADDSGKIVARVTRVHQDEAGRAHFEARFYDTAPARDIAALVHPADGGPPGLRSVSIAGSFLGEPRTTVVDGKPASTADDMEVEKIDFTASPGVTGAVIAPSSRPPFESTAARGSGRTPIFESWEEPMPAAAPMSETQFQALLRQITEARSANAPITEADLAETSVARARAIVEADARRRIQAAEQAAVTEAAQLRGLSTEQLGRRLADRMTESFGLRSPGWADAHRARGGRTLFDA
ncbi:hypothetical protein KDL01_04375 [Actinospica durhamensis]|uniref:Uncharacterized protein n=1 Tax=Actinospica durhamensis TaxID=1508375 RepID=A0A941ENW6_9ACTN|nr:hypothetical protein [Actinospica durhamensis]MBR7832479.1 hypothetical protein [Actinospica durhamensis]